MKRFSIPSAFSIIGTSWVDSGCQYDAGSNSAQWMLLIIQTTNLDKFDQLMYNVTRWKPWLHDHMYKKISSWQTFFLIQRTRSVVVVLVSGYQKLIIPRMICNHLISIYDGVHQTARNKPLGTKFASGVFSLAGFA